MRVVEALTLQHAKTVVTPVVEESESNDGECMRACSWESVWALESQSEKASMHDVLDADKTSVYRSARLNYWAVDRPNIQYSLGVCSKYMSSTRVNDWQKFNRVGKIRERMSRHEWQQHPQIQCAKRQWLDKRQETRNKNKNGLGRLAVRRWRAVARGRQGQSGAGPVGHKIQKKKKKPEAS